MGNGGVSLRKITHFLKAFDQLYYLPNTLAQKPKTPFDIGAIARFVRHHLLFAFNIWPFFPKVNEDVFWGMLISRKATFFKVPSALEAVPFAFDNEPSYLYGLNGEQLPFACHAWEKFDLEFLGISNRLYCN